MPEIKPVFSDILDEGQDAMTNVLGYVHNFLSEGVFYPHNGQSKNFPTILFDDHGQDLDLFKHFFGIDILGKNHILKSPHFLPDLSTLQTDPMLMDNDEQRIPNNTSKTLVQPDGDLPTVNLNGRQFRIPVTPSDGKVGTYAFHPFIHQQSTTTIDTGFWIGALDENELPFISFKHIAGNGSPLFTSDSLFRVSFVIKLGENNTPKIEISSNVDSRLVYQVGLPLQINNQLQEMVLDDKTKVIFWWLSKFMSEQNNILRGDSKTISLPSNVS